jgi:hypothetical protein
MGLSDGRRAGELRPVRAVPQAGPGRYLIVICCDVLLGALAALHDCNGVSEPFALDSWEF